MDPITNPLRSVHPDVSKTSNRSSTLASRLWRWVPVRALRERHRNRIEDHLLGLSERDRYLRFGYPASDERIRAYVRSLDFKRDELFGIFNRRLQLVAMAHLAYADMPGNDMAPNEHMAEFAVSVLPYTRGRGYGARLFDNAVMHARNRRISRLMIHALSENSAMLRIASNAGARVQHDGVESEAWLTVPPETVASQLEEMIATHAAELSYGLSFRRRQLVRVLMLILSLRQRCTGPR